ncbi:cysteine desulfurase [Evansella caseinilytica]|uniref:Cysteine desulfurase n=1 Tax=Evansella caseinilytica TaxID=1503961 RepID=A0A1H3RSW8_9BACI|nr:cysteine desulfurase family protein [Evansella caseinilytica]SDZ28301.1 cysteine desulfurase [Evansella caseinilytica]
MIYFDNSATTRPYKEVIDTYTKVSLEFFGNPSSLHPLGKAAERLLQQAREVAASLLGVKTKEVVFTSGGTEGNNLAIKGTAMQHRGRGKHIITTNVEHASTKETFRQLEGEGFEVTYLEVDSDGVVSVDQVKAALTKETILVSVIHVNNETGSIQPVTEIGGLLRQYPKIVFHVDHVQGIGKVPLHFAASNIDLCSISGHKFHGLKGNGILYVRDGIRLYPLLTGGSQERGSRAGTENVAGVAAMVKALRMSKERSAQAIKKMAEINSWLERKCLEIPGVVVNSPNPRAPHILNLSVPGIKPEVIVQALAEHEIYISTKSACASKHAEPSHVLLSMGFSSDRASSAIRLSFTYDNTMEEAEAFVEAFASVVASLKKVVNKQ